MKYYKVVVLQGHHGRGRAMPMTFYVAAENAVHASRIAQKMPGVQHSKIPMSCVPISVDEYLLGRQMSAYRRQRPK